MTNTSENKEVFLFLACHAAHESPKGLCLLDSGCSNHITCDRVLIADWFILMWERNEIAYIYSHTHIYGNKHSDIVNLGSIKRMKHNKL